MRIYMLYESNYVDKHIFPEGLVDRHGSDKIINNLYLVLTEFVMAHLGI
jgi:hypothetical protein